MQRHLMGTCGFAAAIVAGISISHAAPVTGTWTNAVGQGDGPITNANTNSPVVGDGSVNSAEGEMIHSPFSEVTLSAAGHYIEFTGTVTLVGTPNSLASSGTPRTQFRYGVFDGDNVDDLGWIGYYMSNKHGNAGTPAGTLAEKPSGNTTVYLSSSGQTNITSVQGDGTNSSLFHDDTYTMSLKITRDALGGLLVAGTLTGAGSNGFTQSLSGTDASPGTYTFDRLGFLLGGNLDADQGSFSNLDIATNVPEPAAAGVLAISALGLRLRRRRA